MPEWLDQLLVAGAVLAALGYLAWRSRARRAPDCCASGCAAAHGEGPALGTGRSDLRAPR